MAHGTGVRIGDERLEMHKTISQYENSDARVLGSYSVVCSGDESLDCASTSAPEADEV